MEKRLKILKAVLLLKKSGKKESKEKLIEKTEKYYGRDIDVYIQWLKDPYSFEAEDNEDSPEIEKLEEVDEERLYTSCTAGDYTPACPWNAPGMSVRDFI